MKQILSGLTIALLFMCLSAVTVQAGIIAGDSVLVDFNNASDANDFVVVRDDTPSEANLGIAQNAAKGVGTPASGGVEAINVGGTNGSNDLAALYGPGADLSAGAITLNTGDTLTLSMKYKISDNTRAATPRLGVATLSDVNVAIAGGTDINSGKDMIGDADYASGIALNIATGGNKSFNIVNSIFGTGRALIADPNGPYDLVDSAWYQFVLDITKSSTADEFDVTATLNLLNADGTALDTQIGQFVETVINASMYSDDVVAGFTFVHDGGPTTVSNEYDDLSISVVEIPEPASMMLIGLGGLAMLRRNRKA